MAELEANIGRGSMESIRRNFGASDVARRERLDPSQIEIRHVNIEQDAKGIASIWRRDDIVEHISGMSPMKKTPGGLDVVAYSRNRPQYHIAFATEEGIKELYKNIGSNKDHMLLVAQDKGSREIVGTIEVAFSTATGLATAGVGKWASIRPGAGKMLLRSAHAAILTKKDKENQFAYKRVTVGIISDVEGSERPRLKFKKAGYREIGVQRNNCVGWNVRRQRFEHRDTWLMAWENIPAYRRTDLEEFLPK